jgi:indole-3-acetate O-methyltransferase
MATLSLPARCTSDIKMMGDYHETTRTLQEESLSRSFQTCYDQIDKVPLPTGSTPWCVLDLGSADGLNSIPLFRGCVEQVRKRDPDRSILLVFEDQPVNDFARITSLDPSTFGENAFPVVSYTGFFAPTVPKGSVHLSFSSHSMHYFDGPPPCALSRGLQACDAVGDEKAMFAQEAARCWERLLLARAAELVPGGRSVLVLLTVMENGTYYGAGGHGNSLYGVLGDILRDMLDCGELTQAEMDWATSPEYYRTIQELRAPFDDPESSVSDAGLKLVSATPQVCPCPLRAAFMHGTYEGREKEYGELFAQSITSFTRHKLERAFQHPGNKRTEPEKQQLIQEIYKRFAMEVQFETASSCVPSKLTNIDI